MNEQQKEPCVSLELRGDGVELTVAARLRQGAANWTPEEAGAWFARNWQSAQQALWVCLVHRLAVQPGQQLVRQGDLPWSVAEPREEALLPLDPEPVPSLAVPPVAVLAAPAASVTTRPRQQRRKGKAVPAPRSQPASSRSPEGAGTEAEEARAMVFSVLTNNSHALNMSDLKQLTEMSDYRVRRALRELEEAGKVVTEKRETSGGRWKEIAFYRLAKD